MEKKFKLGIIGAGNMASAIVGGILRTALLEPSQIVISDKDTAKLAEMAAKGIATTSDNTVVATQAEYMLFAVKPQIAPFVFDEIKTLVTAPNVISIMAGVSMGKLQANLGNRNYARIMPNTPALVAEGMAAIAFSDGFRSDFVIDVFKSLGEVVELPESQFDAVTSLSGSGPAYVYMFIKALIDGGVEGGLDYEVAKKLAIQTVRGSASMVKTSPKPIEELIDNVCSKGGTTIQAVESYRADNLEGIVKVGMAKCKKRSEELGKA